MVNFLDESMSSIIKIMIKLIIDYKKSIPFLKSLFKKVKEGKVYPLHHYTNKQKLFDVVGGRTGGNQRIIEMLELNGIIKKDDKGYYYDVSEAKKEIKSSQYKRLAELHDLGDIFG